MEREEGRVEGRKEGEIVGGMMNRASKWGWSEGQRNRAMKIFFLKTAFYPVKVFIKFSPRFTSFH